MPTRSALTVTGGARSGVGKMIFAMIVGAMMARDSFPIGLKAQYGADLSRYTAKEIEWLFKPMNSSRTFEPLVFATRLNVLDQDRR